MAISSATCVRRSTTVLDVARGFGRAFAVLVLVGVAAACGSSADAGPADAGGGDAGAGVDARPDAKTTPFTEAAMRAAATAFNAKFCPAYQRCDPPLFQYVYGTIDACLAAGGNMVGSFAFSRYIAELTTPYGYGSLLTPDAVLACAAALDFSTCDAFVAFVFEGVVPPVCSATAYGFLPTGSPCALGDQCKTGRCSAPGSGACGQCIEVQAVDAPCTEYFQCPPGSTCTNDGQGATTCKRFRNVGERCDPVTPCHLNLLCAAGVCARPPADGSCNVADGCSAVPYNQVCNPVTMKCELMQLAPLGATCAGMNPFVQCSNDAVCTLVHDAPADAGSDPHQCLALIPDGNACDLADYYGQPCARPDSVCYQGICQQNGPAQCSPPPVLP